MALVKRICLVLVLFACASDRSYSQMIIIPETQSAGIIVKQQLWSVLLNNLSGESKQVVLHITVTDMINSQPLMQATSNIFSLGTGAKRVTYNNLLPMNYSFIAPLFAADRQLSQPLPVGEYLVCYDLIDAGNAKYTQLASECIRVIAEPLSPPQLVQPANETVLNDSRPLLTWTPPAPIHIFTSLSYTIIVSPLYTNQSPQEALQRNIPVMTISSANNSIPYTSSFTDLEPGKKYVWQVAAMDGNRFAGKSEVWLFSIMPDSVKQIVNQSPFVKLEQQSKEATIMHQGFLKMEYYNLLTDTTVKITVYKLSERNNKMRQAFSYELPIRRGQNLLEYDINNKMRLDESVVYEAVLTNSKGEKWTMRFNPKYYF